MKGEECECGKEQEYCRRCPVSHYSPGIRGGDTHHHTNDEKERETASGENRLLLALEDQTVKDQQNCRHQ
jgi:hypothetical protein